MTCSHPTAAAPDRRRVFGLMGLNARRAGGRSRLRLRRVHRPAAARGYNCVGLDLSPKLIGIGRRKYPDIEFVEGDVEHLPFPAASLDGVLLSGIVHHLPDPSRCAAEVVSGAASGRTVRGLRPEPHEPVHVALSRPVIAILQFGRGDRERASGARRARLADGISAGGLRRGHGISYRTCAIAMWRQRSVRWLLPIYNAIDGILFAPGFMRAVPLVRADLRREAVNVADFRARARTGACRARRPRI